MRDGEKGEMERKERWRERRDGEKGEMVRKERWRERIKVDMFVCVWGGG